MLPNCNTKLQIGCNFMLLNVVALKNTISNGLRVLRVAATSICSVAAGTAFCLPLACKNAPLGQRQGGVFRVPPPYLWTPPTPQRNNCDRRQRRKQGAVVGAAASKTRVPPKARCGCWVPQPDKRRPFKIVRTAPRAGRYPAWGLLPTQSPAQGFPGCGAPAPAASRRHTPACR